MTPLVLQFLDVSHVRLFETLGPFDLFACLFFPGTPGGILTTPRSLDPLPPPPPPSPDDDDGDNATLDARPRLASLSVLGFQGLLPPSVDMHLAKIRFRDMLRSRRTHKYVEVIT